MRILGIGYCWFTAAWIVGVLLIQLNWSSNDAPAWVQAVGSISAIVAAIFVAAWQTKSQRWREELRRQTDSDRKILIVHALLKKLANYAEMLVADFDRSAYCGVMKTNVDYFDGIKKQFEALPLLEMPSHEIVEQLTFVIADLNDFIKATRIAMPKVEIENEYGYFDSNTGEPFPDLDESLADCKRDCLNLHDTAQAGIQTCQALMRG